MRDQPVQNNSYSDWLPYFDSVYWLLETYEVYLNRKAIKLFALVFFVFMNASTVSSIQCFYFRRKILIIASILNFYSGLPVVWLCTHSFYLFGLPVFCFEKRKQSICIVLLTFRNYSAIYFKLKFQLSSRILSHVTAAMLEIVVALHHGSSY